MVFFCDTPWQSLGVAVLIGVLAGLAGVYTQSVFVVVGVAIVGGIGLEIALHEFRKDEQYLAFKRSWF